MLKINAERLLGDLEELGQIGRTPDGGVARPAMSSADVEGRKWFRDQVDAAGLTFRQDGAGNLSAVLPAARPAAPTLLAGSHLDTVPNGGRFDGALGVLSALEALRTIKEAGLTLPVHLEAVSFTDEEGSIVSLLGSRAATGQLVATDLAKTRSGQAEFAAGMERLGISRDSILASRRTAAELAAYVELHVEQGTRLETGQIAIGVVTGIVGIRSCWLHFTGQAAHAGTMPMADRSDALWGASAFVQEARRLVVEHFTPGVMNCGQMQVQPGAFNIVPARVDLALEFRHGTEQQLEEMAEGLLGLAHQVAHQWDLSLAIEESGNCVAAPMDPKVVAAIERSADKLGLSHMRLLSFAGHDAQSISTIAPSAMIFVPSVDGVSHNPREFTRPEDVVNGANTLLHTLLDLADRA